MPPYLTTVTSFATVSTENGVDTVQFLEASEGLIGMFDLFGSAAFAMVQTDLRNNTAKVQARYEATKSLSATLESLVENEKTEKKRVATEGLMWLLRGLSFTRKALEYSQAHKSQELSASFTQSYEETLKKYHNFVVKGVFSIAMKACPYRADFYKKLAADPDGGPSVSDEELNEQLDQWLEGLRKITARMETFYKEGGHDKGF